MVILQVKSKNHKEAEADTSSGTASFCAGDRLQSRNVSLVFSVIVLGDIKVYFTNSKETI